ncbi:hypothetical protein HJFPF1_09343 [Paramyrothecium foliicola]|nr:hypothetical protein HJFPF1_09343 [Paramyrothecium foliicola]
MAGDNGPQLGLDAVGIFWIIFAIIWTIFLLCGILYLHANRHIPLLRIRGLPLSFAAVTLLHIYWLAVQLGYIYGSLMSPGVEFWIMGIWLPCGIALFHASNSQFLYVAAAQKKYARPTSINTDISNIPRSTTLLGRYRQMKYTKRMLVLVGSGMVIQVLLTVIMFLVSRKFHPSFGIPGTELYGSPTEQKTNGVRGWEWWPSVFWQFLWAWVIAPIVLWRARKLHDTQGWRTQTIACCLSNLHATPMWLVALYVPAMGPVNKYWIPPQWLAISIMLLEIFTIFIPCWEVVKHRTLCRETLETIARWESRQKSSRFGSAKSYVSESSSFSWMPRVGRASSINTSSGSSILTMDALEHTLAKNPEPLQHFSALKDFSGENIAFLMRVREWKATFFPPIKETEREQLEKDAAAKVLPRECFEAALGIYNDFVSCAGAEFQVNLSSADFKKLEEIFESAARSIYGEQKGLSPATPFDLPGFRGSDTAMVPINSDDSHFCGDVPANFDETVFDDAEMSIKYLVLTNTWPKFIKERRSFDSSSSV